MKDTSLTTPRVTKRRLRKAHPLLDLLNRLNPDDRTVLLEFLNKDGCESVYKQKRLIRSGRGITILLATVIPLLALSTLYMTLFKVCRSWLTI